MEEFKTKLLIEVEREKKEEGDRLKGKFELQANDLRGMVEDTKRLAYEKEEKVGKMKV